MLAELAAIPPVHAAQVWPHVKDRIKAAFDKTDVGTFAFCEADVLEGRALLWVLWDGQIKAAGVTKIITSQQSKLLMCEACSGSEFIRNKHVMKTIEDYARSEGCDAVRIGGRKGWGRVFPEYQEIAVLLERKLK